jgi:hypothetical protein
LKSRLSVIGISQGQVDTWAAGWRFFFILGFGRSGTAFMSNLLDQALGAHVFHEPVAEDFYAHLGAHYSERAAVGYLQNFRKREIYLRMRDSSPGVYGEVNGVLRCHADAIRKTFQGVTLIHLVRDGRDVVRSSMPRRTMTLQDPLSMMMRPQPFDPWRAHWPKMDRFARICWYWQEENRRLRVSIGNPVQFEKILTDYDYFATRVLDPCGIHVDRVTWEAARGLPRNTTPQFSMPRWDQWTPEQQRDFSAICGEEMEECGYPL